MSYASIQEAHGIDFARQINSIDSPALSSLNPSRPNDFSPGYFAKNKNTKRRANNMADYDRQAHKNSFQIADNQNNRLLENEYRAWGDIENQQTKKDLISPDEYLKNSLENYDDFEPNGQAVEFGSVSSSPCQSYFYHLDTCRKCQNKLKKRVLRYFKALQRQNSAPSLPGVQGSVVSMDRELFSDYDDLDEILNLRPKEVENKVEKKEEQKVKEDFSVQEIKDNLGKDFTPAIFLILFGLFIIYAMDSSKNIFKKSFKIIKN